MTVSIPNGMEFYLSEVEKEFYLSDSFNSQRDGILPRAIPAAEALIARFNSQRDGILPYIKIFIWSLKIVSIPNGMEFYPHDLRDECFLVGVSIPNGMEFYSTNFAIFLGRKC